MPSKYAMQFFTPELYLRFNSRLDTEALAADEEWETAIVRYNAHLESLRSKMPSQVANLSEICLHDAEVLVRQEREEPLEIASTLDRPLVWPWYGVFKFAVRLDEQVVDILYFLWDHVVEKPATPDWPFSKTNEHWLYDEINHTCGHGRFVHNVLLSSGILLSIPFSTVLITRFSAVQAENKKRPTRTT